jgi:hypothetical protein
MLRDNDRWSGIVSDNNMIGLNAVFNSLTTTTIATINSKLTVNTSNSPLDPS